MNLNKGAIAVMSLLTFACTSKVNEVPEEKFIGVWEIKGRPMFDGIQIRIDGEGDELSGKIVKLNDNKLVNLFAAVGDTWVSDISRSSNFQFTLTERKIAASLFSLYGLSTSQKFRVEFINDNTIGLAMEGSDPQRAKITYKRVQ